MKEEKSTEWINTIIAELNETKKVVTEQMDQLKQQQVNINTESLVQDIVRQVTESLPTSIITTQPSAKVNGDNDDNKDNENKEALGITKDSDDDGQKSKPVENANVNKNDDESTKTINKLKDDIEKLQRQMLVVRQEKSELQAEHDKTAATLKEKEQLIKELQEKKEEEEKYKPTEPSKARQFIEEGKEELLNLSDKVTARLEDLQDVIDHLKLDVTQRKCRPSEAQMKHCGEERKALAEEIDAFGKYIAKVKPIWKKTWEQELQTIVKEQQALKEQEGLLLDMNDDLEALQEVYEQLEKICAYQAKAKPIIREFRVTPAEDGFEGMSSVLKQVATIDVDHDRRVKAMEMADKMRQRELANRTDEFEKELVNFVGSKKLKKTGGAMEIDRLRQEKDKELLKTMYQQKSSSVPSTETIQEENEETLNE